MQLESRIDVSQSTQIAGAFKTLTYAVNPSYRVLISGVVTDELTGEPPIGELTVSAISAGNVQLVPKTAGSGLFCCVGESERLFPLLTTQEASVDLAITVPGYKAYHYHLVIPPASNFPLPPVHITLQRVPIGIQGYVVEVTSAGSRPIAQARVRCISASSSTGVTTAIATLRTPLQYVHTAGTMVQMCQFTLVGQVSQLAHKAAVGDGVLILNDDIELAAGDVVLVGTDRMGSYMVVGQYERGDHQTVVQLMSQLPYSFAAGTSVQRCVPAVLETQTTLARAASMDDGLLYLTTALQYTPSSAVVDGLKIVEADHVEYHALNVLSDENGYYRLVGIGGAQVVTLEVSATEIISTNVTNRWMIEYGQPMNTVDFRLLRAVVR